MWTIVVCHFVGGRIVYAGYLLDLVSSVTFHTGYWVHDIWDRVRVRVLRRCVVVSGWGKSGWWVRSGGRHCRRTAIVIRIFLLFLDNNRFNWAIGFDSFANWARAKFVWFSSCSPRLLCAVAGWWGCWLLWWSALKWRSPSRWGGSSLFWKWCKLKCDGNLYFILFSSKLC